ncbi:MAG: DNA polymerase IV [Planctomycetia bacterium]|nr:MAG: DNA polymerase IV [Planctomycetia bacterium]TVL95508.1 MAG: DNA polymerase IV [Candidatus Brocadia sp. BL1]HQU32018.1 DNA polymerase IV [Candidatus Brocadia sapporoensis]
MRRILHIDMDAFFAAVEQKRNPDLIDKALVIGGNGDPTQRGVVSTASYEARKFGIHSAMPLRVAYKLCPHAVFLPVDYQEYAKVSEKIKTLLRKFCTLMQDVGIDEAFLDITQIDKPSEEIAKEIKTKIKRETALTCSIGIAPNKLLAKIASDLQKPDGLTIVTRDDIENRIWLLPVRKLWGVGPKTEVSLKEMDIKTIGELALLPIDRLLEKFGNSYGKYLYEASRGIDDSPLITHWEPKSISKEVTFQRDIDKWQAIARTIAELTREVSNDMKQTGYKGRTITVKVRFSDFETHTRAKTLEKSINSADELRTTAFDCLRRFELKKKVRLLGVKVGCLEKYERPSHK